MPSDAQFQDLKTELDTDPLSRGYAGMTNEQRSNSLSLEFDRPGPGPAVNVFQYLATQRNRTQQGNDNGQSSILGRLMAVASATAKGMVAGYEPGVGWVEAAYPGDDPFDRQTASGHVKTDERDAASLILQLAISGQQASVDWTDANIQSDMDLLIGNANAGVMKPGDKTAILATSQGARNRAMEIGFGNRASPGDCEHALSLP